MTQLKRRRSAAIESLSSSFAAPLRLIGSSRHSALPAVRERVQPIVLSVGKRSVALLLGSTLIGAAVGFLVQADLGLAPYDVLSSALEIRLGISLGQAGWIVAAVLFLVSSTLADGSRTPVGATSLSRLRHRTPRAASRLHWLTQGYALDVGLDRCHCRHDRLGHPSALGGPESTRPHE